MVDAICDGSRLVFVVPLWIFVIFVFQENDDPHGTRFRPKVTDPG